MVEKAVEELKKRIGAENVLEAKFPLPRRGFVLIKPEKLKDAISFLLKELKYDYLITITGVDLKKDLQVLYHLSDRVNTLSVGINVPRENPKVPAVTDIIPGAVLYEREINDLFGIVADGHPNLENLLLPDGWPKGVYPMRKDVSFEKIKEAMGE